MKINPYYKVEPKEWLLTNNPDISVARKKAIENPEMDEKQIEE